MERRTVRLNAILSGAYEPAIGWMRDDLRTLGLIPSTDPYLGTTSLDPALLSVTGENAIVDWVLLELRNASDSTQVEAQIPLLIQRDGDIVDGSGQTDLLLPIQATANYLSIRHRNHLGVITGTAIQFAGLDSTLDFSNGEISGGLNAQKLLMPGVYGLWAGDTNGDGQVVFQGNANDLGAVFLRVLTDPANSNFARNYVVQGYENTDVNMDGKVIFQGGNSDTNPIFLNVLSHPENGNFSRNFVIIVPLP